MQLKLSVINIYIYIPSKIEWDLTNQRTPKLVELLDTQVLFGVRET